MAKTYKADKNDIIIHKVNDRLVAYVSVSHHNPLLKNSDFTKR